MPAGRATTTSPVSRRLAVVSIVVLGVIAVSSPGAGQSALTDYSWHRIVRNGPDVLPPVDPVPRTPTLPAVSTPLTPWNSLLLAEWGKSRLTYRRYAPALADYRALFANAPANGVHPGVPLIGEGIAEFQRGNYERARIYMTEAILEVESRPARMGRRMEGEALYWISASHLADRSQPLGRIASLLRDFVRGFPDHPHLADAHYLLGLIEEEEGNPSSALEHYLETLRIAPDHWDEFSIRLRATQCAIATDDSTAAVRQLESLRAEAGGGQEVRPDSGYFAYQLLRGEFELNRGRYVDAEEAFIALASTEITPFRRRGMLGLADTYAAAGQADSAFAINSRLAEADATDQTGEQASYNVAVAIAATGNETEAEERLRHIAETPGHLRREEALFDLALIRYRRGENDTARIRLQNSLSEGSSSILARRAHILMGAILLQEGRFADAGAHLEKATPASREPDRSGIDDRVRQYLLAIALVRSGRASDAIPLLLGLEDQWSGHEGEGIAYWLGEAYFESRLYPASIEALERLLKDSPSSSYAEPALYTIGWANLRQKHYDRAEFAFARMVKAYPRTDRTIEAVLRRADCLYALGRFAEAAETYVQATQVGAAGDQRLYADYQRIVALRRAGARFDTFLAATRFQACHLGSQLIADAAYLEGIAAEEGSATAAAISAFIRGAEDRGRPDVRIRSLEHLARLYARQGDGKRAGVVAAYLADSAATSDGRRLGSALLDELRTTSSGAEPVSDPRDPAARAELCDLLGAAEDAEYFYRQAAARTGNVGYELAADLVAIRPLISSDRSRAGEMAASAIDQRSTGGLPVPATIMAGRLLLDLGDTARARSLADSLGQRDLPIERRFAAASLARDAGLPEVGLRILERRPEDSTVNPAPLPPEVQLLRVDLLLDLRRPSQAREALMAIDAERATSSDDRALLDARLHVLEGDIAGARTRLEELMSHPVWSTTVRRSAMTMLSNIYRQAGDTRRADALTTALSRERCEQEAQTPSADHN